MHGLPMENRFNGDWPPIRVEHVSRNDIVAAGSCLEGVREFIKKNEIDETAMNIDDLLVISPDNQHILRAAGRSGYGCGYGYGDGSGYDYGSGSGYGYGDSYGSGYGSGSGYDYGSGSGSGYGYGDSYGSGYGYGDSYDFSDSYDSSDSSGSG